MQKEPLRLKTEKYRVCKGQTGIAESTEVLSNHDNRDEAISALNNIVQDSNWNYYCEEEVFYQNTMFDANKNSIDTEPVWVRMHHQKK
jgi:hypothetical protein